jgi:hypothetical protein
MSNSPNDAFERLKNRPRATVPARNKSLTDSSDDSKTEISHSAKTEISQDDIDEISQTSLTEPKASQDIQEPEAVRRTLRIDRAIDDELEQVCGKSKITRETFLEAAYLACTHNPDLMAAVLVEAQQRYRQRKQAGEQRKFETMSRKYGGTC